MTADCSWFRDARFGMFIHYGVYSTLGRGEWVMAQEGWTREEYEGFASEMRTDPEQIRNWVRLAKAAGMRYVTFTAKHHDGFCQWNSTVNPFNSMNSGPGLDLVKVFTDACREEGMRIGLYYSLADWHHPDGAICATDLEAKKRFLNYTKACIAELLTSYGTIDTLWFDGPWPLGVPENWNAAEIEIMIRKLQPEILINDRLGEKFEGDFLTSEREVTSRDGLWEACMTMNDDWGFSVRTEDEWVSVKDIAMMLRKCSIGNGNLLLNIGPMAEGEVPPEAVTRLKGIGEWLKVHGDIIYPAGDPVETLPFISNTGYWSRQGNSAFFWLSRTWPGEELHLGGMEGELEHAELIGAGSELTFEIHPTRISLYGLPKENPDKTANLSIVKLTFKDMPGQVFPYPHTEFVWDA